MLSAAEILKDMSSHQREVAKSLFGGQTKKSKGASSVVRHPFWMEAQIYSAEHGVRLGEALRVVAHKKPELHQKFLRDTQETANG